MLYILSIPCILTVPQPESHTQNHMPWHCCLVMQDVKEHCLQTRKCLQSMEQHHAAEFGCSTNSSCGGDSGKPAFGRNAAGRQMRGAGSHIHGNRLRRPGWLGHPLIVGGCLLLAMLSESGSTAGRVTAAVPILALLPPCK